MYMSCFNTRCPPFHHHNCFMTTGVIGQTHLQSHVSGIHESIFFHDYYAHCSTGSLSTF